MSIVIPTVSSSTIHGSIVKISEYTASSPFSGYIVFGNIPQTYQDIMVTAFTRTDYSLVPDNTHALFVNNTVQNGWSATYLSSSSTAISSARETSATPTYGTSARTMSGNAISGAFSSTVWHLFNYRSPDAKTCIAISGSDRQTAGVTQLTGGVWYNPDPITSIQIGTNGVYVTGSKITIYGIRSIGQ